MGEPDNRRGRAHASARLRQAGGRPPLRRARGPGDALLRGPGEVRAQPRARAVAHAVPVDDQPVPGLLACLRLLRAGRHRDPAGRRAHAARSPTCDPATRSTAPSGAAPTGTTSGPRCSRTGRPSSRRTGSCSRTAPNSSRAAITGSSRPRLEARHRRASRARDRRPHLTIGSELLGTGCVRRRRRSAATTTGAAISAGWSAATGTSGATTTSAPGRAHGDVHRFRLALIDDEALDRTQEYLALRASGPTGSRSPRRPARGGRSTPSGRRRASEVERIRALIEWPSAPSEAWRKGFLAGVFDAEGSAERRRPHREHRSGDDRPHLGLPPATRLRRGRRGIAGPRSFATCGCAAERATRCGSCTRSIRRSAGSVTSRAER